VHHLLQLLLLLLQLDQQAHQAAHEQDSHAFQQLLLQQCGHLQLRQLEVLLLLLPEARCWLCCCC
jgi:hypothetical protein